MNALGAGIRPLVVLPRQVFAGKDCGSGQVRRLAGVVYLGLGKDDIHAAVKKGFINAFHIITIEQAQARHALNLQKIYNFIQ